MVHRPVISCHLKRICTRSIWWAEEGASIGAVSCALGFVGLRGAFGPGAVARGLIPRRAGSHFARQRGKIIDDVG